MITIPLLVPALCITGCAGVSVKSGWQDGVPHGQTFSKVLIVGVSPHYNQRCDFEYALVSRVKSASTQAFASCDSMRAEIQLTPENIRRVVASVHADAVFATNLVSGNVKAQEGGTSDTRGGGLYKATDFGFGVYGMPVTYAEFQTAPAVTIYKSSVHILTRVYETQNATLIYTLDTVTKGQPIESTDVTILTIADPTAERLRRDRLIR